MDVRQAGIDDLEQVADLFDQYRSFYEQPPDLPLARRFIHARMSKADSVILVAATPSGELAGFTQLFPSFSSVAAARLYVLNDLFIAPAHRRQGVGRALLKAAARFGRHAGAVRLELATTVDNHGAQALYESLDWSRDVAMYHYSLELGIGSAE